MATLALFLVWTPEESDLWVKGLEGKLIAVPGESSREIE